MGMVMSIVGLGMQMAAASEQAEGARITAQANADASIYQGMIARNNAVIAQRNAEWSVEKGDTEAVTATMQSGAKEAATTAAYAGRGINPMVGSAGSVREAIVNIGNTNAQMLRSNGLKEAYASKNQAAEFGQQAALAGRTAAYDIEAGKHESTGILLGGAGQFVGGMGQMMQYGGGGGGTTMLGGGTDLTSTTSAPETPSIVTSGSSTVLPQVAGFPG